jgi:endonuclease/exonuclease/phosphatase (EEP) superfamily protein YafD
VPTSRARAILLFSTWFCTAGLVVVLIARLFGFDDRFPMTQIVAFTPYYIGVGILVIASFLVQRRWPAAALSGLTTVAMVLLVVPRVVDDGSTPQMGVSIRVMSINLRIGGADAGDIAATANRDGVDVIAFQEFTPEAQMRLDGVDLAKFPYRSIHPRELALGSAVYSRLPMTDDGVRRHRSGFYQARGTLDIPGIGEVGVESAHPCAPTGSARSKCWAEDLADQPPAKDAETAQILLGDFNATLDHAAMRRLLASGYSDAASSVGRGLTPTWPYDRPIPKIAIDHVLFNSRISAGKFAVHAIRGTDHRCIIAQLTIRTK